MAGVQGVGEPPMASQQVITFLRDDGKREMMKLHDHTLSEARSIADLVLRKGDSLYVEVEILQ
jgi:hypothetical protein